MPSVILRYATGAQPVGREFPFPTGDVGQLAVAPDNTRLYVPPRRSGREEVAGPVAG